MKRTNYKIKCCGNCEHFILVCKSHYDCGIDTDYHVCDYQEGLLVGEDVYGPCDYDCYKPATKKHMKELTAVVSQIIDRITEVENKGANE